MCGIVVSLTSTPTPRSVDPAQDIQAHRGPDDADTWTSPSGHCALGHRRLSILDLSEAGRQPMASPDGRYRIVFNGEIYNYLELREELRGENDFRTGTDTEVLLAAYARWGESCLDRLNGMFAFAVWDETKRSLFAARDRFGVKPLFYHVPAPGELWLASEIKALHAMGAHRVPEEGAWADYLAHGLYDQGSRTFWNGILRLPGGCCMTWSPGKEPEVQRWYDLPARVRAVGEDAREESEVAEELLGILSDAVALRFRSDVPVGVCLSGGLDSSLLLGLMHRLHGPRSETKTFTFTCGDPAYDETPWVEQMLEGSVHPAFFCELTPGEVPALAAAVQASQDEPFGGIPTLGMAKVHQRAVEEGVTVLLDGNGMDEGWGGYEYYARAAQTDFSKGPVQGSRLRPTRPDCLVPDFAGRASSADPDRPFGDPLRDLQYRDICVAKIPRAMRFADRVSMMYSRELREPFLDYRLVELGLRQPERHKIRDGQGKWLPRQVAATLLPQGVREAPKRPVQTPQREWLRGPLADWVDGCIASACDGYGSAWLDKAAVRKAWGDYRSEGADNSFPIWQWLSLGMISLP